MKGILIDPEAQECVAVDTGGSLEEIYALCGCDLIDVVYLGNGDVLYVDDEGLLKGDEVHGFEIGCGGKQIAGKALCLGSTEEGENADAKSTLGAIRGAVRFLGKRRVNPEALVPRVYVEDEDGKMKEVK